MTRSKRFISLTLIFLMIISITSCAPQKIPEDQAREMARLFMENLRSGDYEKFCVITDPKIQHKDDYQGIFDNSIIQDSFYKSSGIDPDSLDPKVRDKLDETFTDLRKNAFCEFEITNVSTDVNEAYCDVTWKMKELADNSALSDDFSKYLEDYFDKNTDRLANAYLELGADDFLIKVINECLPPYMDILLEGYKDGTYANIITRESTIKIEKIDDKLLVTEFRGF